MDNKLQILIEILTKKSGPDAIAELQKVRAETAAAGGDTSAYDEALKNLNKTTDDAGEKVHGHTLKHQELGKIIQKLAGKEFPELGHAMGKLASGAGGIGAIFLIVGAIEILRREITEYQAKLEEMESKAAQATFLPGIETKLGILRTVIDAQDSYINALGKAKEGEHGITTELAGQLQLQAALTAARSSQAEAEKALALANLTQRKAFGQISDADFIIGKADVEKKYLRDKAAAEDKAKQDAINAATQAAAAGQGDQPALDAKAKAATDAATAENLRQARIKEAGDLVSPEDYEKARKNSEGKTKSDFEQEKRELFAKLAASGDYTPAQLEAIKSGKDSGNFWSGTVGGKQMAGMDDKIMSAAQRDAYEAAQRQKTELARNNPLPGLESAAADARAAALKNQTETTAAADKAKSERDIQDATREATEKARRAQESSINANTASELIKTPLGQTAFAAAGTADKVLAHAGNINEASLQQLNELVKFLGGTSDNQSKILGFISRGNDSIAGFQNLIGVIEGRVSAVELENANLNTRIGKQ